MVRVTRLNSSELVINSDLIEFIEAIPDTIISLSTGKKIMVRESVEEVISKVIEFKRLIVHVDSGESPSAEA
ncbi:MAG TPA: endoflagellar protein [Candidatus Latescibacteria bacterium]|nr:endoflagellar protein [Candidatus Latescibacterota bacterium]